MAKNNSKAPKKAMIFNSVVLINADNVVSFVESLPKTQISEEAFNAYMSNNFHFGGKFHGKDFNSGSHYSTVVRQLGLYHVSNGTFIPRFCYNIDLETAELYLRYWLKLYVVPNPTSQKSLQNNFIYPKFFLKELILFIIENPKIKNIYDIVDLLFGQELSRNDKGNLPNILNKYSDCVVVDKNNEVSLTINYNQVMNEIDSLINNPNRYFEHFGKTSPSNNNITKNPLQLIFFGTPGSGKSFTIRERYEKDPTKVIRTTFHPDTDYASFVGCYKPITYEVGDEKKIKYDFVPQAFTEAYIKAWNDLDSQYYLIIEEINRGNCAQIFGDLFQLLDRKSDGQSEYPINADADLKKYLEEATNDEGELILKNKDAIEDGKLCLPPNLNIIASMNTSDQSLFPMDSAFKRRWSWEYVPIEYDNKESGQFTITFGDNVYLWHDFLKRINGRIKKVTSSEDKQMGNFFIKHSVDEKEFKDKVMFYLWSEVGKDNYQTNDAIFLCYKIGTKDRTEFSFNELYPVGTKMLQDFMDILEVSTIKTKEPSEPFKETTINDSNS